MQLRSITKGLLRFKGQMAPVDRSVALNEELAFWRWWFETGGAEWPQDFRERFNPDQPIQHYLATYIDRLETECVRILDVGSGPLTKLGKRHSSKQLVITATDLLADDYERLLTELEIEPLVRTIYADAERLGEQFEPGSYDVVHGANCVDHMADPLRAIEQMLTVSKPEGWVVLYHAENEGQREQYRQLHQWDFTCEGGSFVIRGRDGQETNVTKQLGAFCEVECMREEAWRFGGAWRAADGYGIITALSKKGLKPGRGR